MTLSMHRARLMALRFYHVFQIENHSEQNQPDDWWWK